MSVAKIFKKHWRVLVLILVLLSDGFIWYVLERELPSQTLTVAFLNVGQGDAIYIESPTHNRIMIDGGPGKVVMNELQKVVPFYVRDIDTLLVTNPDADHYSGFLDMLDVYEVKKVLEPGTHSDTARYKEFEKKIAEPERRIEKIIAKRGMILHLGGGADLRILFPDRDASAMSSNDGSIVAQLIYGSTTVMFTGDAPSKTEEIVLKLDGSRIASDILKVGHHGSRTSASEKFISAVSPDYDIISAGLDNKYGHPHQETLDLLNKLHIQTLITFEKGTITAISDGKKFSIKTEK